MSEYKSPEHAKLFDSEIFPDDILPDEDFAQIMQKNVQEVMNPKRENGITTGYSNFDKKTGGLRMGEFLLLVAETGMGKSTFAINLLCNVIKQSNENCSYFDLENGAFASIVRFTSVMTGQPTDFASDKAGVVYLKETIEKMKGRLQYRDHTMLAPIIKNKESEKMAEAIGELIIKDVLERSARIVVIDPLENFEMAETNYNAIAKVVMYFKDLAQKLDITIIMLHHLNKPQGRNANLVDDITKAPKIKYRIPTIHDILGSSKISNIATDVWGLVRQKDATETLERSRTLVRILKQRNASIGGNPDTLFLLNEKSLEIFLLEENRHE